MPRKILLLEPNYKNKYPPMGLMKLATYFRERGDYVRFFKGDIRDLAVELLFEEFWETAYDISLGEYTNQMREHIKTGKNAPLLSIPGFNNEQELRTARAKYKAGNYPKFDIVAVTTLFTFHWKKTIETINAAKMFVTDNSKILVGGIASSILPDEIKKQTGIEPFLNDRQGALLDRPGQIDTDSDVIIDELNLDYSILEEIPYKYQTGNAYFGYMTRGCVNRCDFCAVPKLEPEYRHYIGITEQIKKTDERFGAQKDLMLLDNNVFASKCFNKIIDEIVACGFGKSATYHPSNEYAIAIQNIRDDYNSRAYIKKIIKLYDGIIPKLTEEESGDFYIKREQQGLLYEDTATKDAVLNFNDTFHPLYDKHVYSKVNARKGRARYIDFNQGVDARLMTDQKVKKLAETNIRPLRVAFDSWGEDPHRPNSKPMHEIYARAIHLAAKYQIRNLSNYLLYNTDDDSPEELYYRLQLNIQLCEKLDVNIYSFPMKYHPIDDPEYFSNRNFIGKKWNRKYIRAIQAILNSTHGKIGRGKKFFEAAFGKNPTHYQEILMMPEALIIERHRYDREAYLAYIKGGGSRKIDPAELAICGDMATNWRRVRGSLSAKQHDMANDIIFNNIFNDTTCTTGDASVNEYLSYYRIQRYDKAQNTIILSGDVR